MILNQTQVVYVKRFLNGTVPVYPNPVPEPVPVPDILSVPGTVPSFVTGKNSGTTKTVPVRYLVLCSSLVRIVNQNFKINLIYV